jgi:hypothetical protein
MWQPHTEDGIRSFDPLDQTNSSVALISDGISVASIHAKHTKQSAAYSRISNNALTLLGYGPRQPTVAITDTKPHVAVDALFANAGYHTLHLADSQHAVYSNHVKLSSMTLDVDITKEKPVLVYS